MCVWELSKVCALESLEVDEECKLYGSLAGIEYWMFQETSILSKLQKVRVSM